MENAVWGRNGRGAVLEEIGANLQASVSPRAPQEVRPPDCFSSPSPGGCPSRTAADKIWGPANPLAQPHKTARHIPSRGVLGLPRDVTSFPQTPCHQLTQHECSKGLGEWENGPGAGKLGSAPGFIASFSNLPTPGADFQLPTASPRAPAFSLYPPLQPPRADPGCGADGQRGARTATGRSSSLAQDPGGSES